ncbi:MAG: TatD family hydrolase [Cardiobacteriaceae bacterium]|nr:TatD family hydrolase [Cardiobacteriaceae bacterium]
MSVLTFTDSHCHLDWFDNVSLVVKQAATVGVTRIVVVSTERERWHDVQRVTHAEGIYAAYGLHPLYQDRHRTEDLHALEMQIKDQPTVAIGECGLDFLAGDSLAQRETFIAQLDIGKRYYLPILIHARKSLDMVLHFIQRAGCPRFVIHSFTGSDAQLARIFAMGGYIGIGGTSTYPRAQRLQRQLSRIPADRYLLETDAPDQPLYGRQGQANLPQYTQEVALNLARLRGEGLETISQQSELNCNTFFHW